MSGKELFFMVMQEYKSRERIVITTLPPGGEVDEEAVKGRGLPDQRVKTYYRCPIELVYMCD